MPFEEGGGVGRGNADEEKAKGNSTTVNEETPTAEPAPAPKAKAKAGQITPGLNVADFDQKALDEYVNSLKTGQLDKPTSDIIDALSSALGNLTPSQANQVMTTIGKVPGSGTLATDVSDKLQGINPSAGSTNPYGFDPLSIGQFYQSTLAPYLTKINSGVENQIAGYSGEMAKALQGASPQIQAAYQAIVPANQAAMSLENNTLANSAAYAPAVDTILQSLQGATTAAQQQKTAAAEAPYVTQATTGVTTPATATGSAANSASQTALAQAYVQYLLSQQGAAGLPTATASSTNPTTAAGAATQNQTNALLAGFAGGQLP